MSFDRVSLQLPVNENDYMARSHTHLDSSRIRTFITRMMWTIGSVITLLSFILVSYVYYYAWAFTHPTIAPLTSTPMDAAQLPYLNVDFRSLDGTSELNGWYIPASSKKTVIFSHGYAGNREEIWVPLYDLAQVLNLNNYNVLMFDYGYVNRKQNPSRVMTAGVREAGELNGAIRYAKHLGAEQVYIWGFSMGAGTALQAALVSSDMHAMILDSTFLLQPAVLDQLFTTHVPLLPSKLFIRMADVLLPFTGNMKLRDVPYERVNSTPYTIPLLMIHGQKDSQAPYTITTQIFEHQSHSASELWLPANRGHEMTYRFQSEEYVERTLSFLNTISSHLSAH